MLNLANASRTAVSSAVDVGKVVFGGTETGGGPAVAIVLPFRGSVEVEPGWELDGGGFEALSALAGRVVAISTAGEFPVVPDVVACEAAPVVPTCPACPAVLPGVGDGVEGVLVLAGAALVPALAPDLAICGAVSLRDVDVRPLSSALGSEREFDGSRDSGSDVVFGGAEAATALVEAGIDVLT